MARHRPTAPAAATNLGHAPEWDPPASGVNVQRWTCPCGHAVLKSATGLVYGTATQDRCPDAPEVGELAEVSAASS